MAADRGTRRDRRKSKRSGSDGCVECALGSDPVGVRDSKDPNGPELTFDHATWQAFIDDVKRGAFDWPVGEPGIPDGSPPAEP